MTVDFKFGALQVSPHRELPEVRLGEKFPDVRLGETLCIGGWSCECPPYKGSATALSDIYTNTEPITLPCSLAYREMILIV